jgi:hypothetical protein
MDGSKNEHGGTDAHRLLRVPGIRLEREPEMGWSDALMSYELRNALMVCDRVRRTSV